jgi:hypothetical protein
VSFAGRPAQKTLPYAWRRARVRRAARHTKMATGSIPHDAIDERRQIQELLRQSRKLLMPLLETSS